VYPMVSFASNVVITAEGPHVRMRSWDLNQDQMSLRDAFKVEVRG
jgi:hypothetical protein